MLCLALPLLSYAVVAALLLVHHIFVRVVGDFDGDCGDGPTILTAPLGATAHVCAAVLCAAVLATEIALVTAIWPGGLNSAGWVSLISARYFAWRTFFNTAAYVCVATKSLKVPNVAFKCFGCSSSTFVWPLRFALDALILTTGAHALLSDAVLGLMLQLPLLCVSLIPGVSTLHLGCLFRTIGAKRAETAAARAYHEGTANVLTERISAHISSRRKSRALSAQNEEVTEMMPRGKVAASMNDSELAKLAEHEVQQFLGKQQQLSARI